MRRRNYQPAIKRNQTFALNITSMTDMFTIMLVFLLQTFTSGEVTIDPVPGVRLPSSSTEKNPVDGARISASATELLFDQQKLARIDTAGIEAGALDANDADFIRPLFNELQKLNTNQSETGKIGKVLLQAHQDLPYSVLRKIMYTASMAGFPNLKLVTVAGD